MQTILINNLAENTTDRIENRNLECCLQALENLGYEVTERLTCYVAYKDGRVHYTIRTERN